MKDLESALASRKKTFVIADVESPADIVIDVVGRAIVVPKVVLGLGPRPGDPPGIAAGPVRNGVLRVRLTLGDLAADFTNKNRANDNPRGWKSAADDIASQIEKWVGQRRAEILRRRG